MQNEKKLMLESELPNLNDATVLYRLSASTQVRSRNRTAKADMSRTDMKRKQVVYR